MRKLRDLLLSSSLRTTMSSMEIEEIVEEITEDFEDLVEDEKEKARLEVEDKCSKIDEKYENLLERFEVLEQHAINVKTLTDSMTADWINRNWDAICDMEKTCMSGSEILKLANKQRQSNHVRIILVGKAASGKDHARKILESKGYSYGISYTTRPPRSNEENGKNYHFVSEEVFTKMAERGDFYEHVSFNGWMYGTSKTHFGEKNVFIMTPSGLSKVSQADREKSFVIYFDMDDEVRRDRLSQRNDSDSAERRLAADKIDFENFTDFDIRITNPEF